MGRLSVVAVLGLVALLVFVSGNREQEQLAAILLEGYDKVFAPDDVVVQMDINLLRVIDLDLSSKILTLDTWLGLYWHDDRLSWEDEDDYGDFENVTLLNLPSTMVWMPDITLYHSADGYLSFNKDIHVIIKQNGDVVFIPPVKIHNYCDLDNSFVSGDVSCILKFGPWTYGSSDLDIELHGDGWETGLTDTDFNPDWELVSTSAEVETMTYEGIDEEYKSYIFNITLHHDE